MDGFLRGSSYFEVIRNRGRRQVTFPCASEILLRKPFPLLFVDPLVVAGADAELAKMIPEIKRMDRLAFTITTPRAVLKIIKIGDKLGGEDLWSAGSDEENPNVLKQLKPEREIGAGVNIEDAQQGQMRSSVPFAAEHAGDAEQGKGTLALARRKLREITSEKFRGMAVQGAVVFFVVYPLTNLFHQRGRLNADNRTVARKRVLIGLAALEANGN